MEIVYPSRVLVADVRVCLGVGASSALFHSGEIAELRVVTIPSTYLMSSSFAVSPPSAEATISPYKAHL